MSRSSILALALLAPLATAGPAAARSFVVSKTGNKPAVAVDAKGVAHVVWDTQSGDTSTTRYCKVPRAAGKCAPGTEREFRPVEGDQDFGGPRVYLTGGQGVLVVTTRCCSSTQAPDGTFHSERVFAMTSGDGGATFSAPAWIGTQRPDPGAAFFNGSFFSFGIAAGGTALQSSPIGGLTTTENTVTRQLAISGGVGVSPKGSLVAYGARVGTRGQVYVGFITGDPNTTPIAFKKLANGDDVVATSGPKGADVMYRTPGSKSRYVVRRFAGGRAGTSSAVSEAGFPIFGSATQDGSGRVHAAWQGRLGLTYRRSAKSGRSFGSFKRLSRKSGFFNLVVGANGKGAAAVVYDSNGTSCRVGGFTAG